MTIKSDFQETCRPASRRVHLGLLLLLCAGISIYGSWIPFHFVSKSLSQALADFAQIKLIVLASRSDWAANFLQFLPVGFLGTGICQVDRGGPGRYWLIPVLLVTGISCAASVLLEFSQEWFPDRVPSLSDIGAQTIGSFWGAIAWTVGGQPAVNWTCRWSTTLGAGQRLNNVLILGVAIHVLSLALPLDLTIRPSDIWHKYKAGGVRLVPFQNLIPETSEAWLELPLLIGGSALAGWLLMNLQSSRGGSRLRLGLQLVLGGLAFCSLLEFMQLLVYSRACKVDDIILGTLGVVAGGFLLPWAAHDDKTRSPERLRYKKTLCLAIYLAWLFLFYWWPLDFTCDPASLVQRSKNFFQLPFVAMHAGSYVTASADIPRKGYLFAALAMLIAAMLNERSRRILSHRSLILATWGSSLFLGILIEAGQLAIPSRTADLTDVLLDGAGAACGSFLAAYLQGDKGDRTAWYDAVPETRGVTEKGTGRSSQQLTGDLPGRSQESDV
jgi:VanZ family protein